MRRSGPWLALPLLALGAALAPDPLAAQARGRPEAEVAELRFEGATTFADALLRSAIATRATGCKSAALLFVCWFGGARDRYYLDEPTLRADEIRLRLFYYQRGYREATVAADTVREDGRLRIIFRIAEGRPVRVGSLEVIGGAGLLPEDRVGEIPLRTGEPFSLLAYEAAGDSLESALKNRGYARAVVLRNYFIPNENPLEAQVSYEAIPGTQARFGEIEIVREPDAEVSPGIVRRMLTFRKGEIYRQDELLKSQSNLFGLDVFRHASIQPRLDARPDSIIPVTVQVNEGDIHRVRLGAGVSTTDCVNAEGRWTSRNFLGGARRLEIRGGLSNVLADELGGAFPCNDTGTGEYGELSGSLTADFTQPWFFSPRNTLGLGLFIERRSLPAVFVRNARGGYISLGRSLDPRTSLTLGYRPEQTRLDAESDLFFCVSFVACTTDKEEIKVLDEPHWLAPMTLSFATDRSNALFTPTRGYIFRLEAEHASGAIGSDFAYTRLIGDLSGYRELVGGVVLAAHIRPGWARPLREPEDAEGLGLNPQKRFFAGGPSSVRGFAQYRLGPKVLTVDGAGRLARGMGEDGAGCTEPEIDSGSCSAAGVEPQHFDVRPVGGEVLLEGSMELRFPLSWDRWRAAAFVDFGQVWKTERDFDVRDIVFTPGLGVRYYSPIGPIRVDVGYNGQGDESLPVFTTEVDRVTLEDGRRVLVNTGKLVKLKDDVSWNPRQKFSDRLQFHFSIGQAF